MSRGLGLVCAAPIFVACILPVVGAFPQSRGPDAVPSPDPTANVRILDERVKSPEIRLEDRLSAPTGDAPMSAPGSSASSAPEPSPPDTPLPVAATVRYEWEPTRDNRGFGYTSADRFRFEAKYVEPTYKLNLAGSVADIARDPNVDVPELYFLRRDSWERYQLGDIKASLAMLDDRVKLTLREAHSMYMADAQTLSLKDKDPQTGRGRFVGTFGAEGEAHHERIDVTPIKSDWVDVSAYGSRTVIDREFVRLKPSSAKQDEFEGWDRTTLKGGGSLRIGSVTVSAGRSESERMTGSQTPTLVSPEAGVSLDLADLHRRVGEFGAGELWTLLPSSVYAQASNVQTVFRKIAEGPPDRTNILSLGSSWSWSQGYASVDYYDYHLDSRRPLDLSYDSAGHGLGGSGGFWGNRWSVDSGVYYLRSEDLAPLQRAKYVEYDTYLSATYKPDLLPDASASLSAGRYHYAGTAFNSFSRGNYWSGTVTLDMSKFVLPPAPLKFETRTIADGRESRTSFLTKGPYSTLSSLKVFYQIKGETNEGDIASLIPRSKNHHVIAAVYRTVLDLGHGSCLAAVSIDPPRI